MEQQPKPKKARKPGRPRFAKGTAKSLMVHVRLNAENLKAVTAAAKATKQTVSDWIRSTIDAALDGKQQ